MKALSIIFTLILLSGCVTPESLGLTPISKDQLETSTIVEIKDSTQAELYERARQFVADSFKSAQAVIQYESKEQGRIIGKGVVGGYQEAGIGSYYIQYNFSFTIDIKNGKARLTTSNYIHAPSNHPIIYSQELDSLQPELNSLRTSFSKRMNEPASDGGDW